MQQLQVLQVLSTELVEKHLNRNPRVVSFRGRDLLTVEYDPCVVIPRIVAAEARELGLTELAQGPQLC